MCVCKEHTPIIVSFLFVCFFILVCVCVRVCLDQDFMESQGLVLNDPEPLPSDPYAQLRTKMQPHIAYATPSDFDRLKQFITMDRKVTAQTCTHLHKCTHGYSL